MSEIKHESIASIPKTHKCEHSEYEYYRRKFVPFGAADNSVVSIYEIPPKKSAYPYHYHKNNEETYYIISGEGVLRTPMGERTVRAGELLFFPTGACGAHKLTNTSDSETLVYIDFDVVHDVDITIYPDSDKIGVWGMGINKIFPQSSEVDYYDGE